MAFDAFLKIDGITGEGTGGTITVESFSWGVNTQRNISTGAAAGRPVFTDLTIVKLVDKTSPVLLQTAVTGKHLPAVQLTCRKAGGDPQVTATYSLTGVLIGLFQDAGNRHGGEFPTEEISFSFQKIDIAVSSPTTTT
jgi:type VI secretion system secreted protein Hcp